MSAHAICSASSMYRWASCPPSARLALEYEDKSTEYADEGTAAHAVAEQMLYGKLRRAGFATPETDHGPDNRQKALIEKYDGPAMQEYIGSYTDAVMERLAELENPYVYLEQRLDFSQYVPEGFGTGDVIAISGDVAEIIDLKYGTGVRVSAHKNPQLMLYGLGVLLNYGMIYDIKTVRCTIMQPRLDSISTYEISADDLIKWAETEVKPVAQLAFNGTGEYRAGDWCQFCPAAADCRARAEANLEFARREFARDAALLTPEEAAKIYDEVQSFVKWAKTFTDTVKKRAVDDGVEYPGYKVVEGRSTRKITDPDKLTTILILNGYKPHEINTLKKITALEELCGKKRFAQLAEGCVTKPPGAPAFVPDSDPRPAVDTLTQAREDFTEE